MCIYLYIIHVYIYIYIYIYIRWSLPSAYYGFEAPAGPEGDGVIEFLVTDPRAFISLSLSLSLYIYIYIHIIKCIYIYIYYI